MTQISIVCIGDELLDGQLADRNAVFLANLVHQSPASVVTVQLVRDDQDAIIQALEAASQTADIVVVSGGLGPTSDDVTRDAAATWSGEELVLNNEELDKLQRRFAQRGVPFTANNRRQCMFPASATILPTEVGTAPGFLVTNNASKVLFFPGVPIEFQWFVNKYLLTLVPSLTEVHGKHEAKLFFHGIGESQLEDCLGNIAQMAKDLGGRIGYRASFPKITITLQASTPEYLEQLRHYVIARLDPWLIAEGDEALAQRLGQLLVAQQATLTTAESCTAGGVAKYLTSASGSSQWFERGYITYSNESKVEELGVRSDTLDRFGAVSSAVVCQMALGAMHRANSTYAVAISGIAGPTGGTPEKPVGTVHFGLATPEGVFHHKVVYPNRSREEVRQASIYTSLSLVLWKLESKYHLHQFDGPFKEEEVESGLTLT